MASGLVDRDRGPCASPPSSERSRGPVSSKERSVTSTLELVVFAAAVFVTAIGTIAYGRSRGGARTEIRGDDVFQDVWVDQAEIDREATLDVPDPRGRSEPLRVKLPRDAGHGWALRLPGKGLRGRGDLYVRLKVRRLDRRV